MPYSVGLVHIVGTKGAFTLGAKQCKTKVGNFCEWLLMSLAQNQNRSTPHQQYCLSEVKQLLMKFATG